MEALSAGKSPYPRAADGFPSAEGLPGKAEVSPYCNKTNHWAYKKQPGREAGIVKSSQFAH